MKRRVLSALIYELVIELSIQKRCLPSPVELELERSLVGEWWMDKN